MIDLSGFSDLVPKNGRHSANSTYVKISGPQCRLALGAKAHKEVAGYLGSTVNVKTNGDASVIVLMRGMDRRISSSNHDISLMSLHDRITDKYGDRIACVYLDGSWDDDEKGNKVYVLRADGRKEYYADATVRKLRG